MAVPAFPDFADLTIEQRSVLHPCFRRLTEGISEFTFAGIFLFRDTRRYQVSRVGEDRYVIAGRDAASFFMLPFGLPDPDILRTLFERFGTLKCATAAQADRLEEMGYRIWEDRDNFDYLYRREDLVRLSGRRLHKKKNMVNLFLRENTGLARPLLDEYVGDALRILEQWRAQQASPGDYAAAREALERMEELQLCGGIFYVDETPIAYSLGEELAAGRTFVIHFEKAVRADQYKGVYQYINQAFAAVLPEKYDWINREQDLGDAGLRQAKESYKPAGFVRKYRAAP
jgi:hypothetical protein